MAKAKQIHALEHAAGKFWEAWLDGKTLFTRFGKRGAKGQTKLKALASPAAAKAELGKQVAAKRAEGYADGAAVPAPAAAGHQAPRAGAGHDPRNPAIEKAIIAEPFSPTEYSVYGDWLEEQGDPRGELIALMIAGKDKAAQALLKQHAAYFLGPLAEHTERRDIPRWDKQANRAAFDWMYGYIHRARLGHNIYVDEWRGRLADVLAMLLEHPSGRFLAELTLNTNGDPSESNLQPPIDVLAKRPRPSIHDLTIGDRVDQISWFHVGDLSKLWKALPQLTHFKIEAGAFTLGKIDAPYLMEATFKTGGLDAADARSIARMKAPILDELNVYFGDPEYGGDATVKDIAPLLAREDLPALKHLGLMNATFTDALCALLPRSPLLRQLETLDLSLGMLTDAGAAILAKHADAFAHLDLLDLSDNYLTPAGVKLVKKIARKVIVADQKDADEPDDRYVSIGE